MQKITWKFKKKLGKLTLKSEGIKELFQEGAVIVPSEVS